MFLKHVSNWNVRVSRNASGKGVSFFVLLVFWLLFAELHFQRPGILFRLNFFEYDARQSPLLPTKNTGAE